jgi:GrpB-like predicted nucleotidyltransferase (UPF0157 family)
VVAAAPNLIIVVPYDVRWPATFREIGTRLRTALGPAATRIEPVRSTAVPGLDAKPVIDVQVSVELSHRRNPESSPRVGRAR